MDAGPAKYLWDADMAAERIIRFTAGKSRDDYLRDDLLRSAVERQFTIIGEALAAYRRAAPENAASIQQLGDIVAFRNVLVHGYADVDDHLVWGVIEDNLTDLRATLARFLGGRKG